MKNKEIKQIKASELFEVNKKYDLLNNNPYLKAFDDFKKISIFNDQTGAIAQLKKMNTVFERINQLPKFANQFQNDALKNNPFFISQTGAFAELNKMSSLFERINQLPRFYNQSNTDLSILEKLNLVYPKSIFKQNQFNKFKIDAIGLSGLLSSDLPLKINEDLKDDEIDSKSLSNVVFLESFSNVKTELKESEISIIKNTFLNNSVVNLIDSFHEEFLQNGFTKELTLFLSNLIPIKDKKSLIKVMNVIISIILLYYTFIKPFITENENPCNNHKKEIENK